MSSSYAPNLYLLCFHLRYNIKKRFCQYNFYFLYYLLFLHVLRRPRGLTFLVQKSEKPERNFIPYSSPRSECIPIKNPFRSECNTIKKKRCIKKNENSYTIKLGNRHASSPVPYTPSSICLFRLKKSIIRLMISLVALPISSTIFPEKSLLFFKVFNTIFKTV